VSDASSERSERRRNPGRVERALGRRSRRETSNLIVSSLAAVAGLAAAFAGCHPTATPVVDPLETGLFAAAFTFVVSRCSRQVWLLVGVVAVVLARGWLLLPALTTVGVAFATVFSARARRRVGAVIGGLGVQVVLRWPPALFHGFPSLVAAALVAVCTFSAWHRSSRRVRRLAATVLGSVTGLGVVFCVPLVVGTLLARHEAAIAEQAARAAFADIGAGGSAPVAQDLRTAAVDSRNASNVLGSWFTSGARLVPVVAQQARFLASTLHAVSSAAAVGAKEAPAVNYHRLGYHDGYIDLVRLAAMHGPIVVLDHELERTRRALFASSSSWLLSPLAHRASAYEQLLSRAQRAASLASQASAVLPGMLGADGTRHYLVIFMTPAESRGYDGFIGSYGLLTAQEGRVSLTSSGPIADLEQALPRAGAKITGPADFLASYGAFDPGKYPQDLTYAPDLPTDAEVLAQVYPQAGGVPIDGVLAIDPYGLAALLHFTGPLTVPGLAEPLTAQNAAAELLRRQYESFDVGTTNQDLLRHDFLQAALHVAFHALTTGSLPAPKTLAQVLDPAVRTGRISFWSFHPSEQPLLRRVGIDGSFPRDKAADVFAVTTQNVGNNKIDAYLHTNIVDRISYDPGRRAVRSEVTITLHNAAPPSGLPPIVIDSNPQFGLPPGTNRTWLTLYSPLALRAVSVDGVPATMSAIPQLGVNAYSTYVNVPPLGTATVTVRLAGRVPDRLSLPVEVRVQPAATPEHIGVIVSASGPWSLSGGSASDPWKLGPAMRQERTFRFVPA